jgi:MscS family membrane protein
VCTRLDSQFLPFAKDLLKVLVIIIGTLVMLGEVFAVNVTALIGGLGIGGLAVAFAAKESLENLIASFTIFIDQPFGVGDLVTAGGGERHGGKNRLPQHPPAHRREKLPHRAQQKHD